MSNRQFDSLDILTYFSFIIGLINYEETLTQSSVQDMVQEAVDNIHEHLKEQDNKIDKILEILAMGEIYER